MPVRVAINGFGRIGRMTLRALQQHSAVEVVAINDLADAQTLAHLLKYDTAHGRFPGDVTIDGETLVVNGKPIIMLKEKDPEKLPDYILLDINMPIMNGWEFLDEYKRLNIDPLGKCKIFIISSLVFSNDINKARSYNLVNDFISKPLNVDKIIELFKVEDPA